MSESIVIANSTIRQQDGLYCLNDLHRASGGKAKSQPSYFLRTQQTQDLVNKINHSANMQSAAGHDEAGAEIGDSGMTRDEKLYELRMLVLGYMQVEDKEKAAEAFMKWQAALKGVD